MKNDGDLGFTWRLRKDGDVEVLHRGRLAITLRGREAVDFQTEMNVAELDAQQQAMARLTGNYKHGNERLAADHPRNKR